MMNLCVKVKIKGDIFPFDWNFAMCCLALQIYRLLTRLENEEGLVCSDVKSSSGPLSVTQRYVFGREIPSPENIAFRDREWDRIRATKMICSFAMKSFIY